MKGSQFIAGVLLAVCACVPARDEAWPTELGVAEFKGLDGSGAGGPDRRVVRRALHSALAHAPMFRPALEEELGEGALELDLRVTQTDASWLVALRLESPQLMRERGAPDQFEVVLLADIDAELPVDAARALALESTLARGVSVLDAKSRLSLGSRDQATRLLGAEDLELRLLALNWIGTQGSREDAEQVRPMMWDDDPRILEAALFAMSRVGTPADVDALIALSLHPDESVARQAYVTLGEVGGASSRAYLQFAARNEDEPQRRRAAELALRSTRSAPAPSLADSSEPRSHRR